MRPAIVVRAISVWVEETRAMVKAATDEEQCFKRIDEALGESRERLKARHLELGLQLVKVHKALPKRSNNGEGWMAFLEAIEMNPSTAYRYMQDAGWISDRPLVPNVGNKEETVLGDVPPPTDADAPREADEQTTPDEIEIDRDTWCTPKWITEAIGEWDLDPCANERSHVQAKKSYDLERRGEDGLVLVPTSKKTRVFLNPPYSDVGPWIDAYKHTRFCFLLKVDPSTKWFEALLAATQLVLIPRRTRVQFEAPENVPPEKSLANQFPHALFYARVEDATEEIKSRCYPGWLISHS